jgi:uncharacterized membrane protein (Fun14 family)
MSEQEHVQNRRSVAGRFVGDVAHMPLWQKGLLVLAMVVGVVGVIGELSAKPEPAPTVQPDAAPDAPPTGRTFVSGSPQAPEPIPETAPKSTWLADNAPMLTRSAVGFIGAFIVGWAFRVFIKTMVTVTVLGAGLLLALSYYGVLDVDFTAARQQYASATAWLWDQASHLKTVALSHLPSTTSGVLGLFVGLRKK